MFHWNHGLFLTKARLAVDVPRRQPRAFISHAHADHIAPHEYALATPETAALYQARLGPRLVREMPYRQPIDWGGLRLTAVPAGHCLGSAMLLAEDERQSLLYTGDFRLGPSETAAAAELPRADILVMESTFGDPAYRFPPRAEVVARLLAIVAQTLAEGAIPVIEAYALGKAQEVTRILTRAGFAVAQHAKAYAISQVYEACGVDLGGPRLLAGPPQPGEVLVVPPGSRRGEGGLRAVRIALTGWAAAPRPERGAADLLLPLSDHADYDELVEAAGRVGPKVVYCLHGPPGFAERLRALGHDAHALGNATRHR